MRKRLSALWARVRSHPTLVIQAISAVLAYVVTYQIHGLSPVQAAAIVAVLSALLGAYNAWKVRPVAPAVWQTLVTTFAALLGAYGFHFTQEQVGNLQFAVISVMALLTWQSVSPTIDGEIVGTPTDDDQAAYATGRAPAVGETPRRIAY